METVHEALGLKEDWVFSNQKRIEEILSNSETVSDAMEKLAMEIKVEEFGEGDYTLSSYEKKLIMAGFHLQMTLMAMKAESAMHNLATSIIKNFKKED